MTPDAATQPAPGGRLGAAAELVGRLTELGTTIAVAESLTGGSVVASLVDVAGASRCVRGGVVAYASDLKVALLGVDPLLLAREGAVHPDVALAMARGVRARLGADLGVATTGVAGPDPQDGRPPGTFHVAVAWPGGERVVSAAPSDDGWPGRAAVRRAAQEAAVTLALAVLLGRSGEADPPVVPGSR
ncbi:CinA family protein [Actinotalea subterranea]|uniref:CinA family protein n=1 Tax=Actinotalea subterranea TaxID=2607497 RepID=UPI001FEBF30D|nr:nicotinamide-nucleotide amidohydrolase family protein [Actinotalea subterranea]